MSSQMTRANVGKLLSYSHSDSILMDIPHLAATVVQRNQRRLSAAKYGAPGNYRNSSCPHSPPRLQFRQQTVELVLFLQRGQAVLHTISGQLGFGLAHG